MKVQGINFVNNSDLQSWSHHHDHEHQQPTTDVIVSSEVILGLYNGFMFIIQILTKNIYSVEGRAATLQVSEDHYEKDSNFLEEQQLKGGDYDYANLEQFWEPADQESGLKEQLFCLNVKEIPIEELELSMVLKNCIAHECITSDSVCNLNSTMS